MENAVIEERRHLMNLGYRMLGTVADAEDAVQETYARWYRLTDDERAAIDNPQGWLTRVAGRVCLDMLGSARSRREQYVGEWLPEPVPESTFSTTATSADPLDRVTLDDTVSTALLVVLESLTPAERVVFVLHDVFAVPFAEIADTVGRSVDACRQLASSARRRVRDSRALAVERSSHDAVVRAFEAACLTGDLNALVRVLDPAVVLRSDGGGFVSAARKPVTGAENVARFLLGILTKRPQATVVQHMTGDGLSFATVENGVVFGLVTLSVIDDRIADVWIMMNPAKLSLWRD